MVISFEVTRRSPGAGRRILCRMSKSPWRVEREGDRVCVCVCVCVRWDVHRAKGGNAEKGGGKRGGGGGTGGEGQEQGDMLESSGLLQRVTEGRGKENGRGAVDCVEDVWLAVQRRRPGVPRRSFGISLTPSLIISLFLCGPAGFVAGSGMHLTSRGDHGLWLPPASNSARALARENFRSFRRMDIGRRGANSRCAFDSIPALLFEKYFRW